MNQIIVSKKEKDKCRNCGSSNIVDQDNQVCCQDCGEVLKDDYLTEETTFMNQQIVGQRYQHESRQESRTKKARELIISIANEMDIQECAQAAIRIYSIADEHRFIKGRHTSHVVAACLYISCRQIQVQPNKEHLSRLLIDFSDYLQINLFVLGSCFLKLVNKLRWTESDQEIPLVDPSLYIRRYCEQLEFGTKVTLVAQTASRIASRMKQDWISYGRRPASICGASILIAARIHNFRRTTSQIVQVVHVCEETIRKRIEEFKETPVAKLTLEEFEKIDLEKDLKEEKDPPSFRKKQEKIKEIENINLEQLEKETSNILQQLEEKDKNSGLMLFPLESKATSTQLNNQKQHQDSLEEEKYPLNDISLVKSTSNSIINNNIQDLVEFKSPNEIEFINGNQNENNLHLEIRNSISNVSDIILTENPLDVETLSDIDDDEINQYMLTEQESNIKGLIWHSMHKDWLQENKNQADKLQDKKINVKKRLKKSTDLVNCPDAFTAMKTQSKLGNRFNEKVLKQIFPEKNQKFEPEIIKKKKFENL